MFTDECHCEDEDEDEGEGVTCDCEGDDVDLHYQSPKEVDGDYSYAYSDSVSPAFLIRINARLEEGYNNGEENIYEEITEKHQAATGSNESTGLRNIFQRAKDSVRRTSRNLEENGSSPPPPKDENSSFHLSISKGRKATLLERANVDWDNEGDPQLEDILKPAASVSSPSGEDTQDDSGFHSGGMEEPNRRKKSKNQRNSKINRCESLDYIKGGALPATPPGGGEGRGAPPELRVPADSAAGWNVEQFRLRSRILEQQQQQPQSLPAYPPAGSPYNHPPPAMPLPPPPASSNRKKSYLSRLVSLPFLKGGQQQQHPPQPHPQNPPPPPHHHPHHHFGPHAYGPNNNIEKFHEDAAGRTFYL